MLFPVYNQCNMCAIQITGFLVKEALIVFLLGEKVGRVYVSMEERSATNPSCFCLSVFCEGYLVLFRVYFESIVNIFSRGK